MKSTPPRADRRPHDVAAPHGVRTDPYYWLRDDTRSDPQVLAHLAAENAHTESVLAPAQAQIEALYREIVGRLKQDDSSVPARWRGHWYTTRYETGREYPIIVRRADRPDAVEVVLLDCNQLAAGHAFFQLGGYEVSQDSRLLAWTEDTVGRRQFRLRIRDLTSGELLADTIENIEPGVVWANDNRTLLYVEKDPVTLLGRRVRSHALGAAAGTDPLLYEEPDESFDLAVERSRSDEYLFIGAESTNESEWRFAPAAGPSFDFQVFLPRQKDHEYQIDHLAIDRLGDRFYVRTNWQAQNFRVVSVAGTSGAQTRERSRWQDVVAHDPAVFIHDIELFHTFIAVSERSGGLRKIRLLRPGEAAQHLAADDPAYTMDLSSNPEPGVTTLRYTYASMTTPATTYEYDVVGGTRVLLKREQVLGDFDPANYASEFLHAPARDGERVPVSIVYRKGTPLDGTAPLFQYGYGSYGICIEPAFSSARLALLDRGFVYAIAHIRGGQELGRRWYDAGRLLNKWNTFHDFLDVTDHLLARGYGAKGRIYAGGGSAGGLLMGTIVNVAPEKYAGIVAQVPFVDIVTTMLDESIPLTTLEYEEWGNPNDRRYYDYILSYSPYDNVRAQAYPPMFVETGLWDSQVQYYEPAKWVAKLRALKTDENPLLLHVNLEAGHGGKSGRFERLREIAREYGFILHIDGGS